MPLQRNLGSDSEKSPRIIFHHFLSAFLFWEKPKGFRHVGRPCEIFFSSTRLLVFHDWSWKTKQWRKTTPGVVIGGVTSQWPLWHHNGLMSEALYCNTPSSVWFSAISWFLFFGKVETKWKIIGPLSSQSHHVFAKIVRNATFCFFRQNICNCGVIFFRSRLTGLSLVCHGRSTIDLHWTLFFQYLD